MQKDSKNASPVAAAAPKANGTTAPEKNAETQKPIIEIRLDPITERVSKIGELQRKTVQLSNLVQSEKDLSGFVFGSDKQRDKVTIVDSEGEKFETTNTGVISIVVGELKKEFRKRVAEVQTEILTFQL